MFKSVDETFSDDERMTSGIDAQFATMKNIACPNVLATDAVEEWALTGKTELRYDSVGKQWIQNWATPKGGAGSCFAVTMKTGDGSSITANFKLK